MGAVSVEKMLTITHVVGLPILPDALCTKIFKCDYKFFFQTRYATIAGSRCDAIHMRPVKCDDTFTHTIMCHRVTFIFLTSTILVEWPHDPSRTNRLEESMNSGSYHLWEVCLTLCTIGTTIPNVAAVTERISECGVFALQQVHNRWILHSMACHHSVC